MGCGGGEYRRSRGVHLTPAYMHLTPDIATCVNKIGMEWFRSLRFSSVWFDFDSQHPQPKSQNLRLKLPLDILLPSTRSHSSLQPLSLP